MQLDVKALGLIHMLQKLRDGGKKGEGKTKDFLRLKSGAGIWAGLDSDSARMQEDRTHLEVLSRGVAQPNLCV